MTTGFKNVDVESDSLLAVKAVNGNVGYQQGVGHIIDNCRMYLADRDDVRINHIRRLANRAAHSMARFPSELNCFVDFSSPPRSVLDSMRYDLIS